MLWCASCVDEPGLAGVTSGGVPGVAAQPGCYVAAYVYYNTCSMLALCVIVLGVHADSRSVCIVIVCYMYTGRSLVYVASANPANRHGRTVTPDYVCMLLLA